MTAMTPRERVLAAINFEEPDRVPIVLGSSNTTGMKVKPYQELKEKLGIQGEIKFIYDWPELGTVKMDEQVLERLHSDVRGVLDRFPAGIYNRNKNRPPHSPFIDDWGTGQLEIEPGVWFPGIHPLAGASTPDEIEAYSWPDMTDSTRLASVRKNAERIAAENQYAIIGTPWLMFPFERAIGMQGLDQFLLNMSLRPDFVTAMLQKITSLCKTHLGNFLEAVGDLLDIVKIGDDLGTQKNLLISPKMYRQILKPVHADLIAFIKERTEAKVFFHSDGDVFDLIDDFIEIGVDILNPVQTSAGKMADLPILKKRCGKKIALCGAIDTQKVLPKGTTEEIRQEVRRVIEILGPDGGYLLSSVHTIMNDIPAKNILAMVDAALEFGQYPINRSMVLPD